MSSDIDFNNVDDGQLGSSHSFTDMMQQPSTSNVPTDIPLTRAQLMAAHTAESSSRRLVVALLPKTPAYVVGPISVDPSETTFPLDPYILYHSRFFFSFIT